MAVREGYIALGANLGDRSRNLACACEFLAAPDLLISARSPVFETHAVGPAPQPDFLNAAVRIETALPARAVLDRCLSIENALGRVRRAGSAKAPRTLDLDLLLLGAEILDEPGLTLPHPEILARDFVLVPLARVARPGLCHPVTGTPLDGIALVLPVGVRWFADSV